MTTDGQQDYWIGNQGQGKVKEVDKEDGEMTAGFMQEQLGQELQEIQMNGVDMRRARSYTG